VPNSNSKLSGDIRGDCIYVYDEDEEDALETLKHDLKKSSTVPSRFSIEFWKLI
jgi:hypothetical protein